MYTYSEVRKMEAIISDLPGICMNGFKVTSRVVPSTPEQKGLGSWFIQRNSGRGLPQFSAKMR
jgi:hypothetical protein